MRRRGGRARSARRSNTLTILIGALTLVSLTIGIILGVRQLIPDPEPPRHSVLVLMDTSRSMKQRFGSDNTKLEAVRAAVLDYARKRPDSAIALRFTGGVCSEGYVEPPVTFGRDNTSEIKVALQDTKAQGKSDFASGLSEAVNDFDHYEAGRSAKAQSIWAFLGSGDDECTSGFDDAIEKALEGFDRDVTFDFFGVGASPAEKRRLKRLVAKLKSANYEAYVMPAPNPSELKKAVQNTSQRETPSP